jgi:hypothetical protein
LALLACSHYCYLYSVFSLFHPPFVFFISIHLSLAVLVFVCLPVYLPMMYLSVTPLARYPISCLLRFLSCFFYFFIDFQTCSLLLTVPHQCRAECEVNGT